MAGWMIREASTQIKRRKSEEELYKIVSVCDHELPVPHHHNNGMGLLVET